MTGARPLVALCADVLMCSAPHPVTGQNYPAMPIRIVNSEAGSNFDLVSRTIALGLSASLGQQVITVGALAALRPNWLIW